ncbi:MAG: DivIVA domain-containing protein [Lactobacillus sp.]|nr:DivIVA domain-containing protein [Lactobacillus sp.]MDN6052288.1 DivIVA domain-containing protein [Lactobacillus sp.]
MTKLTEIKLSAQDILHKQFKTKSKGFDPDEVDTYLDQIISDYETFGQVVEDLYGQIGKLQRQLMEAQTAAKATRATVGKEQPVAPEVAATKPTPASEPDFQDDIRTYTPHGNPAVEPANQIKDSTSGEISTNMAIIQRISTLERKVYNLEQYVYTLQKD